MTDKLEISFAEAARVELGAGVALIVCPKEGVWSREHADKVAAALGQAFRDSGGRIVVFGHPVSLTVIDAVELAEIESQRALAHAPAAGEA